MNNKYGFKPLINNDKNSNIKNLSKIASDTLRIGDMNLAVELPKGEDLNEWMAVNTIEFYNEISLIYGCLTEFCTKENCPKMSAGNKFEYLWAENYQKPLKLSAPNYIEQLMSWVENQLSDEALFPCKPGEKFPNDFMKKIRVIFKRLFRIYAHIYHSHFNNVVNLEAELHLNTSFKHFIFFVDEFKLIEETELGPLSDLIKEFKNRKKKKLLINND